MIKEESLVPQIKEGSKAFWLLIYAITFIFIVNMLNFYSSVLDWGLPLTLLTKMSILFMALICIMGVAFFIYEKDIHYINILLVVFAIIVVLSTMLNYQLQGTNLVNSLVYQTLWVSIFIIVYYEVRKTKTTTLINIVNSTFPIILLAYFYIFYSYEKAMNITGFNLVYYVLLFLPFVLCIKRYKIKAVCLFLITLSIIISLKRTAIIAFLLALLIFFIVDYFVKGRRREKKYYLTVSALFTFIVVAFFYNLVLETFNLDIVMRLQNLDVDGGSGRDIIYSSVWANQLNSTLGEWILGRGYNGVSLTEAAGMYSSAFISSAAHNDFLEVLYNHGILGLLLYIMFWFKLLILGKNLIKVKSELAAPFAASIIMFFLFSMFSILILYPRYFLYLVIFWAICFGEYKKIIQAKQLSKQSYE
jgi:O-antigen ligase